MQRTAVIDANNRRLEFIVKRLDELGGADRIRRTGGLTALAEFLQREAVEAVVVFPRVVSQSGFIPDMEAARSVLNSCVDAKVARIVLISSAMAYGASPHNPGLLAETHAPARDSRNAIRDAWLDLELAAEETRAALSGSLAVLRLSAVAGGLGDDCLSRLLNSRVAMTVAGHDPVVQALSCEDLAQAVMCAIRSNKVGVFNIAPDQVMPLWRGLKAAGSRRVGVPKWLQRPVRAILSKAGLCCSDEHLDYFRYSWTVSNAKARRELGFAPVQATAQALCGSASNRNVSSLEAREFDDFGMDTKYIARLGRTVFDFLERYYWRIEVDGIEKVPGDSAAVLVGLHRGFMPWDGIMLIHQVMKKTGRCPRFLMHPGLVKPPFIGNFMTKIGGVIACRENANRILDRGEILGVFPEGINGAFALYRDAYKMGKFLRNDFVKMALRHGAPIIPFVTIGSAEIFPIIKRIEWRWWKRRTDWPCLPLTPTFPFLPVPLPSKWHTQFLNPIRTDKYLPEAADDPQVVRAISREVRSRMEEAIERILSRRKSIFYGSVFEGEAG